ncbi:class I adenylate-forming enzyme family protein [Pullulanibacillus sp. KACC 23026]|uniref:class I adenylate-forming enzyme family protein n=1 Tax=Pullulanibacillus sp. KACC 23026 TaxID=3028315 RepID=UPI0023B199FD|nr:class I adenylate-forming enzyme family protein [Pullulanibacillus sp. KACC 23026]WEG14859.1 class I adenylate-forming enzyme family protein [Pullulanibacillus sp. KACC 23026]
MFDFKGRVLDSARAKHYLDEGIWKDKSFVDLLMDAVKNHPDLVHKDEVRSISYSELWEEVNGVAASLYDMGIRKRDRVAIQLPNTLDYVIAIFGIARIGAISVTIQVDLGQEAIISSLNQAGCKAWIIAENFRGQPLYETALEIKNHVDSLEQIILQGDKITPPKGALTFKEIRSTSKRLTESVLEANRPEALDGFLMVFTSGTTGSPKGVVHYHANYIWSVNALSKNFEYQTGDGVLCLAPISHQTGMLAGIMMTIASAGRIFLLERFSANRVIKWVETEKPSFMIGAPPHVIHTANSPKLKEADTSSVKTFIYAGAPVPKTILERLQNDAGIKVGAMYGWTEGFVGTATKPTDPIEALSSTVGFALPGIEIRLVDEEGHDVNQGEVGEMWSRGPNFSPGYYENEAAAKKQWDSEGWFHTGDLLRLDENGRFSFVARADDIINRGGTKVDPKSVEDVIAGHESVERVTVVGAPHETLGQQTIACIVLKEGAEEIPVAELRDYLGKNGLAKFQFPDQLRYFNELPMTHSGKIKNKVLREQFLLEQQGS